MPEGSWNTLRSYLNININKCFGKSKKEQRMNWKAIYYLFASSIQYADRFQNKIMQYAIIEIECLWNINECQEHSSLSRNYLAPNYSSVSRRSGIEYMSYLPTSHITVFYVYN